MRVRLSLRPIAAFVAAATVVACGNPGSVTLKGGGAVVEIEASPFSLVSGPIRMHAPATTVDRYTIGAKTIPGWDALEPHEQPWRSIPDGEIIEHDDTSALIRFAGDGFEIDLQVTLTDGRLKVAQTSHVPSESTERFIKSRMQVDAASDERFFGMGERYATVDHRGTKLYSWAEEAGLGQGEDTPAGPGNPYPNGPSMTYYPVPFYHSSAGYGLHVNTSYFNEIDFASQSDRVDITASTATFEVVVYLVDDPIAVLDLFTADTGRPYVPAPWVFGPRRRVSINAKVDGVEEWRLLRARGVPTTGIDDAVHFLPHNSHHGREDALRGWVAKLHDHGFKVMAYNNPYISQTAAESKDLYSKGAADGLFVLDASGQPGLTVFLSGRIQTIAAVDFTNEAATAWFQDLLRRTLALGYDGWMHDFGEYIERDWSFFNGGRGDELHNLYPVMSAKAAYDLLSVERPNDFLFFVRSGYTGTQAYVPAVWSGDPEATFDETQGLPAMLRGGINLGLSAVPYWGSDISGFKCFTDAPRDKEMYLRWGQLGAVSPIMMDQNACNAVTGRPPKWTLWSDEETTQNYGAMARLHTRLQPYFLVLANEAATRGTPMMRHPFLLFPKDAQAHAVEDAFFLGSALYAAPVARRNVRTRQVYLPPGRYVDWDDYSVYEGGEVASIPAPLTKLPLLLVENQILPLWDASIETLAPSSTATVVSVADVQDRLDAVVALSPGGRTSIQLADGTTLIAERGADAGNPGMLVQTSTQAIAACTGCFVATSPGAVRRLQVSTTDTVDVRIVMEDLTLTKQGGPKRRIRWDVLRL